MGKTKVFNVGDKVFAKVKGYPAWPAQILENCGRKYKVEFYGTKEIGMIKDEDIDYFLKNKHLYAKISKRINYNEALEEIEQAIKEDGGDGETTLESVKTNNISTDISDKSADIPDKKRKRTSREKQSEATAAKKKTTETPTSKLEKPKVKTMEVESEVLLVEEENEDDCVESSVPIIKLVSEKHLNNIIKYVQHVKSNESPYKTKPPEPREDHQYQVLPVTLPSKNLVGIKLHKTWPLDFSNEYDRANYDEKIAENALKLKTDLLNNPKILEETPELFILDLQMTEVDVQKILETNDIIRKRMQIDRLKTEAHLVGLDAKIKGCLQLDKAEPKDALGYLKQLMTIDFDELMLKKHAHVVEMIRRLRNYVGNTDEWNLSEVKLRRFQMEAEKIRDLAEKVYEKIKVVMKISNDSNGSSWDKFRDILTAFRTQCQHMTETQIYVLCDEPSSRQTFLDQLEDGDGKSNETNTEIEKENSSEVANLEKVSETETQSPPLG